MADEPLQRQVEDSGPNPQLVAMKKRIDAMQIAYIVLFIGSLVLLITNWQTHAQQSMHVLWAISLGAAVLVRVIRQQMVTKYNSALLGGRPGPLT